MDRSIHSFITLDVLKLQLSFSSSFTIKRAIIHLWAQFSFCFAAIYIKIYALFNHKFVVVGFILVGNYLFSCFITIGTNAMLWREREEKRREWEEKEKRRVQFFKWKNVQFINEWVCNRWMCSNGKNSPSSIQNNAFEMKNMNIHKDRSNMIITIHERKIDWIHKLMHLYWTCAYFGDNSISRLCAIRACWDDDDLDTESPIIVYSVAIIQMVESSRHIKFRDRLQLLSTMSTVTDAHHCNRFFSSQQYLCITRIYRYKLWIRLVFFGVPLRRLKDTCSQPTISM